METPAEPPLEEHDPAAPRMWQLWRPFVGIHQWYFSPGYPPPLRNLTGWTAVFQTTMLCAAMGLVAGALGVVIVVATSLLLRGDGFIQVSLLGFAYGITVIFPLSRWMNRNVFWSAAGIVVCVVCFCVLIVNAWFFNGYIRSWTGRDGTAYLRFLHNLAVFAPPMMLLGVFMLGRQRRPLWMLFAVFFSVAVFAFSMESQRAIQRHWPRAFQSNVIVSMTLSSQPLLVSWMCLTVALGMRLWPSMRGPEPPAS